MRALRGFARLDEAHRKRVNLHEGIDGTLLLLGQELEGVTLEKRYGELPEVDCFPNELFEPGFTRWTVDVGAGLGLSTCQQIVARHGGRIEVTSKLGAGSTFTVHIPRA